MSIPYGAAQQGGIVPVPGTVPNLPYSASAQAESRSSEWQRSNAEGSPYLDFFKKIWNSPVGDLAPEFLKNTLAMNPTANILALLKYFAGDDPSDPSASSHKSSENSAETVEKDGSISGLDSSTLNYMNAELAKVYGMDRTTAYQEALSNTAYQRAVRDMKNAGLNPAVLFGGGRGSSASGVSYIGRNTGSGSGSGFAEKENLFSDGVYNGIPVIVGLIASIVGRNPKYFAPAQMTATAVMGLMDDFSKGELDFN